MDVAAHHHISPWAAAGIALLAYLAVSTLRTHRRLRAFPGPFLASVSHWYIFRAWLSRQQAASYGDVNKTYQSRLVRIGPNDLITDDPELVRRMNGARSQYARSSWYTPSKPSPHDDGLINMLDTKEHDRLRAKMAPAYAGRETPGLEDAIGELVKATGDLIRRKYISAGDVLKPVDFARVAQLFTLDVITRVAYGKEFGYLRTEEDIFGYMGSIAKDIPWIGRILYSQTALRLYGPRPTDESGMGKVSATAEEIVAKRFETFDEKTADDMLGSFIRHGVPRKQCKTEIPFQIVAGSDTTASAVRGTILCLVSSRTAYGRLQREIDDAIAQGRVSDPIKLSEARELEYLQAVIYEGLRMMPPFSGLVMKKVPPEGDTIDGKFVPGGTRIGHNNLGTQRSTKLFGPDADVFRPERWLGKTPEEVRNMSQVVEMVFGYGRWQCLGKHIAFLELNKIFVELLRYFDFQLMDPRHPWDQFNLNLFVQKNMWMKVTARDAN